MPFSLSYVAAPEKRHQLQLLSLTHQRPQLPLIDLWLLGLPLPHPGIAFRLPPPTPPNTHAARYWLVQKHQFSFYFPENLVCSRETVASHTRHWGKSKCPAL